MGQKWHGNPKTYRNRERGLPESKQGIKKQRGTCWIAI